MDMIIRENKEKHKTVPNAQKENNTKMTKEKVMLHSPWCHDECKDTQNDINNVRCHGLRSG